MTKNDILDMLKAFRDSLEQRCAEQDAEASRLRSIGHDIGGADEQGRANAYREIAEQLRYRIQDIEGS